MLAAVLTGGETRGGFGAALKRSGWKVWPLALIAGWSFSIGQQLLLWAGHQGSWHSGLFPTEPGMAEVSSRCITSPCCWGLDIKSFGLFALNLVLSVTAGSLITMLIGGIGEGSWVARLSSTGTPTSLRTVQGHHSCRSDLGLLAPAGQPRGYNGTQASRSWKRRSFFRSGTIAMSFALAWLVVRTGRPVAGGAGARREQRAAVRVADGAQRLVGGPTDNHRGGGRRRRSSAGCSPT